MVGRYSHSREPLVGFLIAGSTMVGRYSHYRELLVGFLIASSWLLGIIILGIINGLSFVS
jgi:hypothetical protein